MTEEKQQPLQFVSHRAIDRDRMAAIELALPEDADRALLSRVAVVAKAIERDSYNEMEAIRDGSIPAPAWASEPDAPGAHEMAEADWLNAERRREEAESLLQTISNQQDKLFPRASVAAVQDELATNPTNDNPNGRGY